MCGRFGLFLDEGFGERFSVEGEIDIPRSYNIAPGMETAVVTRNSPNRVELMRWGLLPPWARDPRLAFRMINAKAETVKDKPAYRTPFRRQRCLVPANGFYEWKRDGKAKIPHYFYDQKREYLSFAGLYEIARDGDGREVRTYTIITTTANKIVGEIHERMPVILAQQEEDIWLDKESEEKELLQLLNPYDSPSFVGHEVGQEVNKASNNSPDLIVKVD